jgi:3-hydroxyisobutyrate dehydrogenase-like beta-hydroxyacid dehydrogenase
MVENRRYIAAGLGGGFTRCAALQSSLDKIEQSVIRKVGFIGLGTMGKPMAIKIAKAGFDLMVYDIREQPLLELHALGTRIARSLKEVAKCGELVEVPVLDDAQLEAVLFGEAGVLMCARPAKVVGYNPRS